MNPKNPLPPRPKTLAAQHEASSSIRALSKQGKGEGRKDVVKAVLASPLTVPWYVRLFYHLFILS